VAREEVLILNLAPVVMESNVCISPRAFLCNASHDFRVANFDLTTKLTTVRNGSWLGAQSFIAPGMEIGEGNGSGGQHRLRECATEVAGARESSGEAV
jgi:acetyltransferase-like isoleucine patch superfamily enzyme